MACARAARDGRDGGSQVVSQRAHRGGAGRSLPRRDRM